jgi:hypothetical protein
MNKTIEDYKNLFEERATIYEYDGGFTRMAADNRAADYVKELYAREYGVSYDSKEMEDFIDTIKNKRSDKTI